MKYCTKCGTELEDSMAFCPKCGESCGPVKKTNRIENPDTSVHFNTSNPVAVVGFVFGIITISCAVLMWIIGVAQASSTSSIDTEFVTVMLIFVFLFGPAGIGCSIPGIVLGENRNNKKGLAIAGLVCSIIGIVIGIVIPLVVGSLVS